MNTDETTTTESKAEALIARIEAASEAEFADLRAAASDEAGAVVRAAHAKARARVRGEIETLKRSRSDALRHEDARLDTARRQLRQREAQTVIAAGLPEVVDALQALWADKGARLSWAMALVQASADRLPPDGWTIEHPEGWDKSERDIVAEEARKRTGQRPGFRSDPALTAGLRIRAGKACLDASPLALMADEAAIGAALQAELAHAAEAQA